jgi:phosphoglycerate dehydrogenase-like enzyme
LARNICLADRQVRGDLWNKPGLVGSELLGKVLGVVGLGRIGSQTAFLGRALGMRVVASIANPTSTRALALGVQATELMEVDDLLGVADVVCLAVPLNDTTRGLIGERELARMKPSALLVNVARAEVVDEDELCRALRDGVIAGAATDVVTKEAHPSLTDLDNTIVTPHIGAMTYEAQARIAAQVVAGLRAAFNGQDVPNRIL